MHQPLDTRERVNNLTHSLITGTDRLWVSLVAHLSHTVTSASYEIFYCEKSDYVIRGRLCHDFFSIFFQNNYELSIRLFIS